jgi:hypothetical protein
MSTDQMREAFEKEYGGLSPGYYELRKETWRKAFSAGFAAGVEKSAEIVNAHRRVTHNRGMASRSWQGDPDYCLEQLRALLPAKEKRRDA